jgi:hypothetical protein
MEKEYFRNLRNAVANPYVLNYRDVMKSYLTLRPGKKIKSLMEKRPCTTAEEIANVKNIKKNMQRLGRNADPSPPSSAEV